MEIVLTFAIMGIAMTGMSIGIILNNQELNSSCGGMAALDDHGEEGCGACGKKAVDMCPSDEELVRIAQIAHPNPEHHR